jgi:multiple sugar transport system substrate-binding protein
MLKKLSLLLALALVLSVLAAQCAAPATEAPAPAEEPAAEEPAAEEPEPEEPAAPAVEEITILWAQWDPADYLQQVGNLYEEETGIKVNVVQEPWPSFSLRRHDRLLGR